MSVLLLCNLLYVIIILLLLLVSCIIIAAATNTDNTITTTTLTIDNNTGTLNNSNNNKYSNNYQNDNSSNKSQKTTGSITLIEQKKNYNILSLLSTNKNNNNKSSKTTTNTKSNNNFIRSISKKEFIPLEKLLTTTTTTRITRRHEAEATTTTSTTTTATIMEQQQQQQENNEQHNQQDQNQNQQRDLIIGGNPAVKGVYPSFGVPQNGGCGSVLIYNDILLTAAHCERNFPVGKQVYIGGTQLDGSDATETVTVLEEKIIHPDYNSLNFNNDIMLIKITPTTVITPVTWNTNTDIPNNGQILTAIGHGRVEPNSGPSPTLLQVNVPTVPFGDCQGLWRSAQNFEGVAENIMICVSYPQGQGTCKGDSGGPLYIQNTNTIVGITSFGHPQCSTITVPNVITRVSAFDDFINQVICSLADNPPSIDCTPFRDVQNQPCRTLRLEANACLSNDAPNDCSGCIENAFNTITGSSEPVTCISFESTMCGAIGPNNPNSCNCDGCRNDLQNYYNCILTDASNGQCNTLDCIREDPCNSLFQQTNECLINDAPTSCSTCVQDAISDVFNAGLVSCESFEDGVCPAISFQCDCDPCREILQNYYACTLDDLSDGLCTNFDCSLPCAEQFDTVNTCLLSADFLCPYCIQEAVNGLFANDNSPTCDEYESGVCTAITSTCSCEPCLQQLDDYYACVLDDATEGACNTFDCCSGELSAANTCLQQNPSSVGNCGSCVQQAANGLFTSGNPVTCDDYENGICNAIYGNCQGCGPCQDVLENYYSCNLSEATNRQCDDINCGCSSELMAANTCLNDNPVGDCGSCVQQVAEGLFAGGNSVTCDDYENGICNAIYSNCQGCGPCQEVLENYYSCSLSDTTDNQCNGIDCGCVSALATANTCLSSTDTTGGCGGCVQNAYNALFANGASPSCNRFETAICNAITTDCACLSCQQELKTYYACSLSDSTNGNCGNAFECTVPCSGDLNDANVCLDNLGIDGGPCKTCVRDTYDGLFANGASPTCENFASTMCTAINTDCGACEPCSDQLELYYDCLLSDETDNLCSVNCAACESEPCGIFGFSIFCPFSACGIIGRLLGLCACSGSAFSWLTRLFA